MSSKASGKMRSVFLEKPDPAEVRARTSGWGWVWVWLPAVIAVAIIAGESTDTMSASNTSGWLRPVFERIFGRFTDVVWSILHHWARKSLHFAGYGMVCLTFVRAWLLTLGRRLMMAARQWRWGSSGLGIGSAAAVASLDEWHQTFLPSRTGQVSDVLIDTCGATVACVVVWTVAMGMRRRIIRGEER